MEREHFIEIFQAHQEKRTNYSRPNRKKKTETNPWQKETLELSENY